MGVDGGHGYRTATLAPSLRIQVRREGGREGGRGGCAETYEATDIRHTLTPLSLSPSQAEIGQMYLSLTYLLASERGAPPGQSFMPFPNEDNYSPRVESGPRAGLRLVLLRCRTERAPLQPCTTKIG